MHRALALAALLAVGAPAALAEDTLPVPAWADQVPAAGQAAVVTMVDAGKKPREPLRFAPKVGAQPGMQMRMQSSQTMSFAGMTMPLPATPAMVYTADVEVTEIQPDGDIAYSVSFRDAGLEAGADSDPQIRAGIEQAMASVKGAKATMVIDARGATQESSLAMAEGPGAGMAEQATEQAQSIVAPLPAEPVGVGARWRTFSGMEMEGMKIAQRAEYHLVEREGNRLVLEATVDQAILSFDMSPAGMPPGAEMRLTTFDSKGSTRSVLHLDHLTPTESSSTMELRLVIEVEEPSIGLQTMEMTNKTVMTQTRLEE